MHQNYGNLQTQPTSRSVATLSSCTNFTGFSFLMKYQNKKGYAMFGCRVTLSVRKQQDLFSKDVVFINSWIRKSGCARGFQITEDGETWRTLPKD